MHAATIIAWGFDGSVYCPDCKPADPPEGARRDPPWPMFADGEGDVIGSTCDACRACYVAGDGWQPHDVATGPLVRWARCESCNGCQPIGPSEYRETRRRYARLGVKACPNCMHGRMLFQ